MSSRILSAFFNDFKKGNKQRSEIRDYLIAEVQKDPLRFGHLMSGLDQAQYEHPIPVTDFLLLRREVEAALNDDEQTMFVPHPTAPSPDTNDSESTQVGDVHPDSHADPGADPAGAETLVAAGADQTEVAAQKSVDREAETLAAVSNEDDPTVVPGATKPYIEYEETMSHSQRSDGVKEVELPTLIGESATENATSVDMSSSTAQQKAPLIPGWGWLAGGVLLFGVFLISWSLRPFSNTAPPIIEHTEVAQESQQQQEQTADENTTAQTNQTEAAETAEVQMQPAPEAQTSTPTTEPKPQPEAPSPHWSAEEWLAKLQERADQGFLLPESSSQNAYVLLEQIEQRFPESKQVLAGRRYLKDAYLKGAETARENSDWELSQQYLDAAFNILKPKNEGAQGTVMTDSSH